MDRAELSPAIIAELGQLFAEALKGKAAKLVASDLDGIEQTLQEISRGVLGRVVEETVAAIARAQPEEHPRCPECGQPMRLVERERPRQLQGLVGDYALARAYFFCDACRRGIAPLDEHLGIGTGALSPGLERVACRLGISDSFAEAADALRETLRVELAGEAIRRVTEGLGAVAEAQNERAVALAQAGREPLPKGEIQALAAPLLVEVDGALVHETDGQWHEVKSGLAAPLGPKVQEDRQTGRQTLQMAKPSYCAGFESAETFWYRVYVEACRRGLGTTLVTLVVLLGDGADWIWRYGARFLGLEGVKVIEILDVCHALEHLGVVAHAVFGQGTEEAKAWFEPLAKCLVEQGAKPILEALRELRPGPPEAKDEVRKALEYFSDNAARMDYPRFIALQLPIGSGAIESTCKTLIEEREKGAGMRWSEAGAQSVASLRALHRSGRWDQFWKAHPQRCRPPVRPHEPARLAA
jgi:Uncharacterised protein family (UPF0236)